MFIWATDDCTVLCKGSMCGTELMTVVDEGNLAIMDCAAWKTDCVSVTYSRMNFPYNAPSINVDFTLGYKARHTHFPICIRKYDAAQVASMGIILLPNTFHSLISFCQCWLKANLLIALSRMGQNKNVSSFRLVQE
jgi:hypothetical protein